MRTRGANGVGRFSVEFEVANYGDMTMVQRGKLRPEQVRRRIISGVVDPGATKLVLPAAVVKELGLPRADQIKVHYADGRTARRYEANGVFLEMLGRHDTFSAIVEPKRQTALIGAMVLEALDLLVDCRDQRLVPRDPRGAVFEIE